MNDYQRSKIMRAEKVVIYLGDNETELLTLANVATYKTALEDKIYEANGNDNIAVEDTTGTTETKADESAEMVESSLKLSAFLQIYARNTNNKTLMNKIDFQRSELNSSDDNRRRNAARYLAEKAQETGVMVALGALLPVPYLPADLTAHETNITEFDDLIGRPNQHRSDKTAYTKAVAQNIEELDDIIANLRIDMAPVQYLKPLLFDKFVASALIDDAPTHHENSFSGTIDANGDKKIAELDYASADELRIENVGTTVLELSFRNEGGSTIYGTATEVASGASLLLSFSSIAPEGQQVWIKNTNTIVAGAYALTLL